jgi:hypothetical protein
MATITRGRIGLLCRVAVHDGHDAKGCDEDRQDLADFPVELEEPHCDDVGKKGVRVPDGGDIAQS